MNIFSYIIGTVGAGILLLGALFGMHQVPTQPQTFGATNPSATPIFDTVLTQQLGTSDTTMYLKSVTDSQGNVLSGFQCFTVDVNSPSVEYLCGTISGTTVITLTRNLSYQTGTTTYATPTNIHRVGADVRITDFPTLTVLSNQASGKDSFVNALFYTTGFHPCSANSASTTLCDKNYIDSSVLSGASPISSTVAGIGILATALQAASSTATGVYNTITYNRLLASSYATDTPNVGTSASDVLMSDLTGHLKQAWLDLTANFSPSGTWNFLKNVGIGTSTPYAPLSVVGSGGVVAWLFNATSTTATSTFAGNLQVSNNATTTNLTVSNSVTLPNPCTNCTITGSISTSTTFVVVNSASQELSQTVYCVSPKIVSGGGYSYSASGAGGGGGNMIVEASQPNGSNGWKVTTYCSSTGCNTPTITVYALCVNP